MLQAGHRRWKHIKFGVHGSCGEIKIKVCSPSPWLQQGKQVIVTEQFLLNFRPEISVSRSCVM
jgi:hypothetical protein